MYALILRQPKLKYIIISGLLLVAFAISLVFAIPIYADYFGSISGAGYYSISSSATTDSHPIVGTSTTSNSYLSVSPTWSYWASAPNIQVVAASSVTMTSARLNAQVTDDGDDDCEVRFGLDTSSHASFTDYDRISDWANSYRINSTAYLDITGLEIGQTYYVKVQVKNGHSTVTSSNEITFTTSSVIGNALGLYGTPSNTSIILTWKKASGSYKTIIRYRTDTYPTSITDGISAYDGTGYQCTVSGLTAGQTYYFSAWGYSNPTSATEAQLVITTTARSSTASDRVLEAILDETTPSNINQAPDASGFQLEPFTSMISIFQGGLGMPINNLWQVIYSLFVAGVGIIIYIRTRNFFLAFSIVFVLSLFGVGVKLLQGWLIFVEVIIGAGVWAIEKYLA